MKRAAEQIRPKIGAAVIVVPRYWVGIMFVSCGEPGSDVIVSVAEPAPKQPMHRCLGRSASLKSVNMIGVAAKTTTKSEIPP
jgi:hypothetical protein